MTPTCPNQCEAMAWGSHLPTLLWALGGSDGYVLEVGIGHFSTPHLHAICQSMDRHLVSVEQNKDWHDAFVTRYASHSHRFIHGEYMDVLPALSGRHWSVVFIDHSPGGKSRSDVFGMFIEKSKFVIVHDYHGENEEAIGPLLKHPITSKVVSDYQPPTLIASKQNIHDLWTNQNA